MRLDASGPQPFGERLRVSIWRESVNSPTLKLEKCDNAYTCGDCDAKVYLIERGRIKTLVLSQTGRECILAVYVAGDFFGELCLAGGDRLETATAMQRTTLRQMPCAQFLFWLTHDKLLEDFAKYLATCVVEQQRAIAYLLTADGEHRLAAILLRLARKLGKQELHSLRVEERISHQELAEMVGTTRPRITEFMQRFRRLGLIETTPESFLIVKENQLAEFLDASVQTPCTSAYANNLSSWSNIGPTRPLMSG
jgi:CRP-like cAMP-binding protein